MIEESAGINAGELLDSGIAIRYLVGQLLNNVQTCSLVRVLSVSNSGDLEPVGTVSVKPLVSQVDNDGITVEHGQIYNIPYFRIQGGTSAVILDPKIGDIGLCLFCSRDSSVVKSTKNEGPPGTFRQFDWADGMYIGGFLNGVPEQYIQFLQDGIKLHSPTKITIEAPDIELVGTVTATGNITGKNAGGDTVSLTTHVHPGVMTGSSNTGAPE